MLRWGLILLVIPALLLMGVYMYEHGQVRACVEAGGSYDYLNQLCDMNTIQPFVPLMMRHPILVNGSMLLSAVGLLMCIAGLYIRPAQCR